MAEAVEQVAVAARAFARLLALGFASPADVTAWVDTLMASPGAPHPCLIDGSLSAHDRGRLIAALDGFAEATGPGNDSAVWAMVLGKLCSWFEHHPDDGPAIARALYDMAVAGECPAPHAEYDMISLDDAYGLATSGAYGMPEDVDRRLREFLACWKAGS